MDANLLSTDGFPPRVWGPSLWKVMHILAFNYPLTPSRAHVTAYYQWFKSLCTILPCRHCREEFCKLVNGPRSALRLDARRFVQRETEPPGSARLRVIRYTLDLHAAVNVRLRKNVPKDVRHWVARYAAMRKKNVGRR
jgi:hypothetical protein